MYREMRRKEKQLAQEELLDILKQGEYGVLSTVGNNGMPYGVPVNYLYEEGVIYFHCSLEGHKVDNMRENPKVSFCVVTDVSLIPDDFNTRFRSVIAFGKVRQVTDKTEKLEIYRKLIRKFSSDYIAEGEEYIQKAGDKASIYTIVVEHMTAKGKK